MIAPLHMVKLPLDKRRFYGFAASQHLSRSSETDNGYIAHALLAALFGAAGVPKPFALQRFDSSDPSLLAYGSQPVEALEQAARLNATPDIYRAIDWQDAASKPMPDAFNAGQILDFTVRVLPLVRVARGHPAFKPGAEVDIFFAKAKADLDAPKPDRQELYRQWLARGLLIGGAELTEFNIVAHRRTALLRKRQDADRTRHVLRQHPDLDVSGTLLVKDPDAFRTYVARGVGRHRAFGYGMLLLKPSRG